ncbi:MAG: outer membrane beta-barrel protein [Solitalea sp.]
MKKRSFTAAIMLFSGLLSLNFIANAQDSEPLIISGSVDTYFKYDFSEYMDEAGASNIQTFFASEQNSISLGMVDVALSKQVGKASFVGEVSFGPRGQEQSLLTAGDGNSFHIQNLHVSYQFTEEFSMTAGFMGTFIGYEVISPAANFNYSTSYLFSSGPFQNAGIKANYAFSEKVGLMVGLFNDWNAYQDFNGVSDFGAQLFVAPVEGWNAYVNFITGSPSGTEIDLTTSYQVTDELNIGLNAADYSAPDEAGGFQGGALYLQYAFSDAFALGARGEYFKAKDESDVLNVLAGSSVTAFTLSANLKAGPLTVIPEFRIDSGSENIFINKDMNPTGSASQFVLAAVYAF